MQNQHALEPSNSSNSFQANLIFFILAQDAAAKVLNGIMRGWGPAKSPCGGGFCRGGRLWRFPFSKRTEFIQLEEQARRRGR